jgi:hypothetical protein
MSRETKLPIGLVITAGILVCIRVLPPAIAQSITPQSYLPQVFNQYPLPTATITIYWSRTDWEAAAGGDVATEDFEKDIADYAPLLFPYTTGNGFLLTGQSSAQILNGGLLDTGNNIHFRDWTGGLTFNFPANQEVSALGFNYHASELWYLAIGDSGDLITLQGRRFVGVVIEGIYPT